MPLSKSDTIEYRCSSNLNLYDSPELQELSTQAAAGRHLRFRSAKSLDRAIEVYLCEDGYSAWLPAEKIVELEAVKTVYQPTCVSRREIEQRIPEIIAFTKAAMAQPNYYLWGGTVAPNYDCSGLIQAAFATSGIWLPRNSYQQADFTLNIPQQELLPGDLIFFAKHTKVDHVALCLGDNYYIHSSGQEIGRNGIGIDRLSDNGDRVSLNYYRRFWGCGRVMSSLIDI